VTRHGLAAAAFDGRDYRACGRWVDVDHHDGRAVASKCSGSRATDTATTPRDDGDPSRETIHPASLPMSWWPRVTVSEILGRVLLPQSAG
jgi:hypothetical protein